MCKRAVIVGGKKRRKGQDRSIEPRGDSAIVVTALQLSGKKSSLAV